MDVALGRAIPRATALVPGMEMNRFDFWPLSLRPRRLHHGKSSDDEGDEAKTHVSGLGRVLCGLVPWKQSLTSETLRGG